MSDDIVKALRELDADKTDPWSVCCEAADEIERLRAELAAALEERNEHHAAELNALERAEKAEKAEAERDALRAELAAEREQFHDGVLCHSAETLKLTAERDAEVARAEKAEAERDALRELLAEAVQWLCVSDLPCAMTIHRINAALNKGGGDE